MLFNINTNGLRLARYYQPNPDVPAPFTVIPTVNDLDFATSCADKAGYCASAWGLRIFNSRNILVYGAGLYSFFIDYSTSKLTHIHYIYIQRRMRLILKHHSMFEWWQLS